MINKKIILSAWLILILIIIRCSINKEITYDSRYLIAKAPSWQTNFLSSDSGSGIHFIFNIIDKTPNKPTGVKFTMWKYPLDTVTIKKIANDQIQPMPDGGIADVTSIYYAIKNNPIDFYINLDSTDQVKKELSPGTYLLKYRIALSDIPEKWIKNIEVKEGFWSILKLDVHAGRYAPIVY